MQDKELLERIITKVAQSKKYANIDRDLIRWVVLRKSRKYSKEDEIIRSSRSQLHQAAGCYVSSSLQYSRLLDQLHDLPRLVTDTKIKEWCHSCMQLHSSSAERLSILGTFYEQIFNNLPKINSILDIGCGFNPLAIPWMPGNIQFEYIAADIFIDQSHFLNHFFNHCNVNATASILNIMGDLLINSVDVVFLFKLLPIIEQLENNYTIPFLQKINAPNLVITYPVKSLGGKNKGMRDNYANQFQKFTDQFQWSYTRIDFESELVFIVKR